MVSASGKALPVELAYNVEELSWTRSRHLVHAPHRAHADAGVGYTSTVGIHIERSVEWICRVRSRYYVGIKSWDYLQSKTCH